MAVEGVTAGTQAILGKMAQQEVDGRVKAEATENLEKVREETSVLVNLAKERTQTSKEWTRA